MILKLQIQEIDFGDVILKALPVLREKAPDDGSAVSKIIAVVTHLPSEVICTMLDAIPREDKHEIVALLVRENQDKLCEVLSRLLKENEIDVSLDEVSLSNELELCITVSNLNYVALAAKYLPLVQDSLVIQENPVTAMLAALLKLPKMLLFGALSKLPQSKKDEAVAYLVNKNKNRIIAKLEDILAKQNIRICLGDLKVEV